MRGARSGNGVTIGGVAAEWDVTVCEPGFFTMLDGVNTSPLRCNVEVASNVGCIISAIRSRRCY